MPSVERIGQYQIVHRVESDITGAVCLVLDPRTQREVIIKMVQLDWFADPEALAPFRLALHRDIKMAGGLRHPAIPRVLDLFEELGLTWVVMEYVAGRSLGQLLSEEQPLTAETFRRVVRPAAEVLDYAHGQGLLHQNVKPTKILVPEDGSAWILGFGQAQISTSSGVRQRGDPIGVPYYLSPEQLRRTPIDARSDQFSLAAIAYQILAGQLPFGGDPAAVRQKIMEGEPVSAERWNPSLGPETGRVLCRALAKNPEERYETCAAFVSALETALEQAPRWSVPRQGERTEPVEVPLAEVTPPPQPELEQPEPRLEQAASEGEPQQATLEPELKHPVPEAKVERAAPDAELEKAEPEVETEPETDVEQPAPEPKAKQVPEAEPETDVEQPEPEPKAEQVPEAEVEPPSPEPELEQPPPKPELEPEPELVKAAAFAATTESPSPPKFIPAFDRRRRLALPLLVIAVILAGAGLYVWSPLDPGSEPRAVGPSELSIALGELPAATTGTPYSHALAAAGDNPPYQWSVSEGAVPPGLTLDASSGMIQGIPTSAGVYEFRLQVTDASQATAARSYSLMVGSGLTISGGSSLPGGVLETAYSHQIQAAGASAPARWSVSDGSLPTGLELDSATGAIHGTPAEAGDFQFALEIVDASEARAGKEFTLSVASGLTIVTASELPRAIVGRDYSEDLAVRAGSRPYRWTLAGGSLPRGLSLDSSSGVIRGAPAAAGTSRFTVRVTDTSQTSSTRDFILAVGSGLTITTAPILPRGIVGSSYSHSLTAGGGSTPYRWAITEGRLPAGLSLDASSGVIRGTPRQPGENRFTARVTDGSRMTESRSFILLAGPALVITTAPTLPEGVLGSVYFHRLAAEGGSGAYLWSVTKGSLPPGISLDASAGALRGVPEHLGTSEFTLQLSDASQAKVTRSFSLIVGAPLTISSSPALPPGSAGKPYLHRLAVEGGNSPYRWSVASGSLPGGLTLDPSGTIRGTPTGSGTHQIAVRVTDASQLTATQSLTLSVASGPAIATAATLPEAEALAGYSQTLEVASGAPPFRWSIVDGSLPRGLSLDPSTGRISGTPAAQGEFQFTALVTDSTEAASSREFHVTVVPALQMSTRAVMPEATVGELYSHKLDVAGGKAPYTWSLPGHGIPPGLSLDPAMGIIKGTPSATGEYQFYVEVASSSGAKMSQLYALRIKPADSGRLVWRGRLESNSVLTIQDAKYASVGQLTGELPGVPVRVELEPQGVIVVEAPGPSNDWKLLVVHSGVEARDEIVIKWARID